MDLWLLTAGFGIMPVAALLLLFLEKRIRERIAIAWAVLAGTVAFLGIAHTSATILDLDAHFVAGPAASAATMALGVVGGLGLGWILLGRGRSAGTPLGLAWAAVVFLGLHSFGDGLVLGEPFAGPLPVGWELTPLNVSATFLHRFAEGAILVVPALIAAWRPPKMAGLLLAGLLTVPAAVVPVILYGPGVSLAAVAADQTVGMLLSSVETGFAIPFLLLGLLPRIGIQKDSRWALAAGLAFLAMFLVHFAVE